MQQTKHTLLSDLIEENIRKSIYQHKLPPVRTMAAEFNVSSRTLNKALKPLIEKGLIIQNGPMGTLINNGSSCRRNTRTIGVFCNMKNPHPHTDFMLKELQTQILNDNYNPLFMNVPDAELFNNEKFWELNWVDGYIFAYNSINKSTAGILNKHGVPFVAANRVPPEWASSWVDFDNESALQNIVKQLMAAGHKTIALDLSIILMPEYADYIKKSWFNILRKEGIEDSCYITCETSGDLLSSTSVHLDYFMKQFPRPTAIIVWNSDNNVRNLYRAKLGGDGKTTLVYSQLDGATPITWNPSNYCLFSYKKIAIELWKSFKQVHTASQMHPIQRYVQVELYFNLPQIQSENTRRKGKTLHRLDKRILPQPV